MQILKKDDPRRKWRSIIRNTELLAKTVLLAGVITWLWHKAWSHGWHFPEDDKDIHIGATITSLGVIWGVFVGWMVNKASDKFDKVVDAVFAEDEATLMRYRDERMLIALHLLMGLVSVPFISMLGGVAYKHAVTGIVAVFCISAVIIAFWFVIALLDNPMKSEWVQERLPPGLMERNVDEYFRFGRKKVEAETE